MNLREEIEKIKLEGYNEAKKVSDMYAKCQYMDETTI